jgi:hypothetical protein
LKDARRKKTISMPYLELLSILYSVNIWQKELANSAIDLQSDCGPVVKAINRGYSKQSNLHHLLRLLFFITSLNNIFISCTHIPGVANIEADVLSRAARHDPVEQQRLLTLHFFTVLSVQQSLRTQPLSRRTILPLPLEDWRGLNRS